MEFTGERMIPEHNQGREIYLEHITRYKFATQFVKGKIVLDIACGSGYGTKILADNGAEFVYGIDVSKETIEYCKRKYNYSNVDFKVGNVKEIFLPENSVDVIISFETLEHVDSNTQQIFMKEIKRILRPGGVLVISTPNASIDSGENPFHLKELSINEFNSYLHENFKYVQINYQLDIEASYIFSEKILKEFPNTDSINVSKLVEFNKNKSYFFVAACSNKQFENIIKGELLLFDDTEREIFLKQILEKDSIIRKNEKIILKKDELIRKNEQMIIERDNYIKKLEKKDDKIINNR